MAMRGIGMSDEIDRYCLRCKNACVGGMWGIMGMDVMLGEVLEKANEIVPK